MTLAWRLGLIGLAALAVVTMIGLGYRHYDGLLSQIKTLSADKATLELALATERQTVGALRTGIQAWNDAYEDLAERQQQLATNAHRAAEETRRLNELLGEHDLGALAESRPVLVERRLNDGTARALRLLRCASIAGGCDASGDAAAGRREGAGPQPDPDPPR